MRLREAQCDLDVIVTEAELVRAADRRCRASRRLAGERSQTRGSPTKGPGSSCPARPQPEDLAGFGVADPTAMLLTLSLLLAEGPPSPRGGADARACGRRRAAERHRRDTPRHRRRARAAARGADRRRDVRGELGDDANARLRRRPARPRARGRATSRSASPAARSCRPYDAVARGTTVRHVLARHEQGAGHMAEGYARASGEVGVAIATSGPGATNLVTPIADAWMDSTPLVCITGQVRSGLIGTDAFQEIDATGHHDADRQALVARAGRRGAAVGAEGGVPRRAHGTAGAGARRHREGRAGGRARLRVSRTTSTCPAGGRRRRVDERQCARRRRRSPTPSGRSSTRAAACSTATRATELLELVEAGAAARGRDADGQGLPAGLAPAELRRRPGCTARSTRTGR